MIMRVVTYYMQLWKYPELYTRKDDSYCMKIIPQQTWPFFFLLNQLYFDIMHRKYNASILSIQFDEYSHK